MLVDWGPMTQESTGERSVQTESLVDLDRLTWGPRTRQWLGQPRGRAVVVWALALAVFIAVRGIPLERLIQSVWIIAGIFAANFGRPWRTQAKILLDWLPFIGFLVLYDYTRGFAATLGMPTHVTQPVAAEKVLFFGTVPTVWLQQHFFDPNQVRWWDFLASLVYFSHFIVAWAIAGVLYVRSRPLWASWARHILVLSFAGLVTYVLYPAAPPWYASNEGVIGPVTRIASRGWDALGLHSASALIARGQAGVNEVAAIPSLHAGFAFMVAVFFWPRVNRRWRVALLVYAAAMGLTLVYAGEHYVFDELLGYGYVAVVALAVAWWERRRGIRVTAAVPRSDPADLAGDDDDVDRLQGSRSGTADDIA